MELENVDGWLMKRGAINTSFKRRHFRLEKNILSYYVDNQTLKPQGAINILNADIRNETPGEENGFELVCTGRIYVLRAESRDVADEWVQTLRMRKQILMTSSTTPDLNGNTEGEGKDVDAKLKEEVLLLRRECAKMKEKMVKARKEKDEAVAREQHLNKSLKIQEETDKGNVTLRAVRVWKDRCAAQEEKMKELKIKNAEMELEATGLKEAIAKLTGEQADFGYKIRQLEEENKALEKEQARLKTDLKEAEMTKVKLEAKMTQETLQLNKEKEEVEQKLNKTKSRVQLLSSMSAWCFSTEKPGAGEEAWKLEVVQLDAKTEKDFMTKEDAHIEYVIVDQDGSFMGQAARTPALKLNSAVYLRIGDKKKLETLYIMAQLKWRKEKKKMIKKSVVAWAYASLASLLMGTKGHNLEDIGLQVDDRPECCLQLYKKPVDFTRDPQLLVSLGSQRLTIRASASASE